MDGRSPLKRWPEGGPKLLWTAHGLGHGLSSLSISGGRIFTAGNIGNQAIVTAEAGRVGTGAAGWRDSGDRIARRRVRARISGKPRPIGRRLA